MRVLGIDLGLRRTGLALSDDIGLTVRLLDNLMASSQKEAVEKIVALVKSYEVTAVVIGNPPAWNKESEAIARRAKSLGEALMRCDDFVGVDVVLWDESFSSAKAMSDLVASGVPRQKRREKLDAAAAAVLVEEYLYWRTHS